MADIDYWNNRYASGGNSGYGSYNEQLTKKLEWLKGLDIQSITELGCGDFNFGSNLLKQYPNASYAGYDISNVIIEKNKEKYPQYNFTNELPPLGADLTLCVDVLFHVLDDNDYDVLLLNLKQALRFGKYLAITAYENEQETAPHLKIRKFDYKSFGEPLIREVVEEDGQMYFYLFENPRKIEAKLDLSKVSLCLLTKEKEYPKEILDNVMKYGFGEVLIGPDSNSPYNKYQLFAKAKNDILAYQDDDAIVPWDKLIEAYKPDVINVGMKQGHFDAYKDSKMTMGLGWGSIFPKSILSTLKKYTDVYGEDEVYQRETERILTYLNPQNRVVLDIQDLPSAWAEDRLWRQPNHNVSARKAEERCSLLT